MEFAYAREDVLPEVVTVSPSVNRAWLASRICFVKRVIG